MAIASSFKALRELAEAAKKAPYDDAEIAARPDVKNRLYAIKPWDPEYPPGSTHLPWVQRNIFHPDEFRSMQETGYMLPSPKQVDKGLDAKFLTLTDTSTGHIRIPSDKVPVGKAISTKDVEIFNKDTGTYVPFVGADLKTLGYLEGFAPYAVPAAALGLAGAAMAPGEAEAGIAAPVRGEMRAAPRGGLLGALADLLGGAKGFLNAPGAIPYLNQGVGDLLMGQAPELADSMSYGFSPIRGAGMAATLDPAVVDLAALMAPLAGRVVGVARNLPGVARQAALDAYGPAVNMARPRYTLGGREVPKEAMQAEFGLLPPADEIKQLQKEAALMRRRQAYEQKRQAGRLNWDPNAGLQRGNTLNGQSMTNDDLLRLILERGKTLPNP